MSTAALTAASALVAWLAVLLAPWQPHRTRERVEARGVDPLPDLSDVTVLVPARNEEASIGRTIESLARQGRGLEVIVVDDQSSDRTARVAERAAAGRPLALRVLRGVPLPAGWAGKLWALEQGFAAVDRPFTLLLDADIELAAGLVAELRDRALARGLTLVSVMAELHCGSAWEKLLAPPFVFFFKLLYPFALANDPRSRRAAAAGGCMLVRTAALRALGGFSCVRGALIDDCSLAKALKGAGGTIWLGMSHSVKSLREYDLASFWSMVSRSAFTQLGYSTPALLATTLAMAVVLLAPPIVGAAAAFGAASHAAGAWAALAWLALGAAYWPTVRFYALPSAWALTLPLAGALFLAMTWTSAARYWRGTRAAWKGRTYEGTR